MPFLSMIVPIFNMEKYLNEFLESIISQGFEDIEFLLINDGSTDSSLDICKYYAARDSRIKIYSKVNGGVASARQFGLEKARGEYVIHADPDDYLPNNALELMIVEIKSTNSDICIGSYSVLYPNESTQVIVNKIDNSNEFIRKLALDEIHGSLWNKMIRSTIAKEVSFLPNLNFMEDKLYLLKILNRNPEIKITHIKDVVYYYRQRSGSYTNEIGYGSIENFKKSSGLIIEFLSDILDSKDVEKIEDIVKVKVALSSDISNVDMDKLWMRVFKNSNFKWHIRLIALFLFFKIKHPLFFYKKYIGLKKTKLGIY